MNTVSGIYKSNYCLTADYCDRSGKMSALAPFTIFQAMAMQHNESIGNGVKAMAKEGKFWLVVHSRVDYFRSAEPMQTVTAETWAERSEEKGIRCYRDYRLSAEGNILCEGRTQWAVCSSKGKILPFSQSGFGQTFPYPNQTVSVPFPARIRDETGENESVTDYCVRRSDLDFMGHMNNISYVRLMLDYVPNEIITEHRLQSLEIRYSIACTENELLHLFCVREEKSVSFCIKNGNGRTAARAVLIFA